MSKTNKESRHIIEQRDHKKYQDRQVNTQVEYRQHKVEKKIENALRSNNIQDLMNIDDY